MLLAWLCSLAPFQFCLLYVTIIFLFWLCRPMEVHHWHCHCNGCVCHVVFALSNALAGLGLSRNRFACSFASKCVAVVAVRLRQMWSFRDQAGPGSAVVLLLVQALLPFRVYLFHVEHSNVQYARFDRCYFETVVWVDGDFRYWAGITTWTSITKPMAVLGRHWTSEAVP